MIKCTKGQIRRLKTALRWKIPAKQRKRIQMVLLRESGMTQPRQFTYLVSNQGLRPLLIIHFLAAIVETVKHARHRI